MDACATLALSITLCGMPSWSEAECGMTACYHLFIFNNKIYVSNKKTAYRDKKMESS